MLFITGDTAKSSICNLNAESGRLPTQKRLDNTKLIMVFKIKKLAPTYLTENLLHEVQHQTPYNLRNVTNIQIPFSILEVLK